AAPPPTPPPTAPPWRRPNDRDVGDSFPPRAWNAHISDDRAVRAVRALIDVSAIPKQPAGAGVYVLRLVEALAASGQVELVLVARQDDEDRWRALAPEAEVAGWAPDRRPLRVAWEQARGAYVARHLRA